MLKLVSIAWALAGLLGMFSGKPGSEVLLCVIIGALFLVADEVRSLRSLLDDE